MSTWPLTHAFRQTKWLRNLLDEMGYGYLVEKPTVMLGDNKQADRWAREHMVSDGNRYIERDFHRIVDAVKRGDIEPRHVGTKLNLSDIFTKSVTKDVITALYDVMRGVGEFPPMHPSEYDLDDVRHQNAATMISTRNASAISEMDRMSTVERHYNFVRQNEADYTDTPTCFDNDLHDSPSGGV